MRLTFFGAARQVTGSMHILEASGLNILVDCGLAQGSDEKRMNNYEMPINPEAFDFILLTHAHIDHSGKIPYFVKKGFKGKILCTGATSDLCQIMLLDSAHIQESDAEWKSRKNLRAGFDRVEPLYDTEDAEKALTLFESHIYNEEIYLNDNVKIRFVDAGHLLGSASIELWCFEEDQTKKIVFSGDIGNLNQPIIEDPNYLSYADWVVTESTYGDREHNKEAMKTTARANKLQEVIEDSFSKGGNVIIPSFSVGRTQEILYLLRHLYYENNFSVPVFVDSPLSVRATKVFSKNVLGYYDDEAMKVFSEGENPIIFPSLVTVTEASESKKLNSRKESCVIISSSGMCEAGRIKHHLKHNLWRSECSIVFTGYQAEGTLGRRILGGEKNVKIFGEDIKVNAKIVELEGLSGHADQSGLLLWLEAFKNVPKKVFVVHGEKETAKFYTKLINKKFKFEAVCPEPYDEYIL